MIFFFLLLYEQEAKCLMLSLLTFLEKGCLSEWEAAGRTVLVLVPASFVTWVLLPGHT